MIPLFFFLLIGLLVKFFASESIVVFIFLCNRLLLKTSILLSITTVGFVALPIPNSIAVVVVIVKEGEPGRSNISFSTSGPASLSSASSTTLIRLVPLDDVFIGTGESDLRLLGLVLFTPPVVIAIVVGIFSGLSCFFFGPSGSLQDEEGSGGTGGNFPHCALDLDFIVFGTFLIVVVCSFSFMSMSWSFS